MAHRARGFLRILFDKAFHRFSAASLSIVPKSFETLCGHLTSFPDYLAMLDAISNAQDARTNTVQRFSSVDQDLILRLLQIQLTFHFPKQNQFLFGKLFLRPTSWLAHRQHLLFEVCFIHFCISTLRKRTLAVLLGLYP